ncbi:hypothetical protein KCP78_19205 [Salmonella enterica subsp. enterica]|nr:hypothetical protein KCP78_19205 [Salmonella enterica subsp. enterica]
MDRFDKLAECAAKQRRKPELPALPTSKKATIILSHYLSVSRFPSGRSGYSTGRHADGERRMNSRKTGPNGLHQGTVMQPLQPELYAGYEIWKFPARRLPTALLHVFNPQRAKPLRRSVSPLTNAPH